MAAALALAAALMPGGPSGPGVALAEDELPPLFPEAPLPPPLVLTCDGNGLLTFRPGVPALGFMCQVTNTTPDPLEMVWMMEGPPGNEFSLGPPAGGPLLIPEFGTVAIPPNVVFSAVRSDGPVESATGRLRIWAVNPFGAPGDVPLDEPLTDDAAFLPPPQEVAGAPWLVNTDLELAFKVLLDLPLPQSVQHLLPTPGPSEIPAAVQTAVPTAIPPMAAPATNRTISLSVAHGRGTSTIIVPGRGFAPNQEVVIRTTGPGVIDREVKTRASADGTFEAKVTINDYGPYEVDAGGVKERIVVQ